MQHAVVTEPAGLSGSNPRERTAARPSRAQIEPAALALLARHSAGLLATARRYSLTPEDAEDAYQRGVEILLTKAPTTDEQDLLPWLKTVVKHEAFAVRKSSGRAIPSEDAGQSEPDMVAWTDERAERYERLRLGAEALSKLKPQEIRCLLLRAEGLSYKEICTVTGWTYTKVNRSITEGRRAFLDRVASIESGAECEQLAPLISKLADGEAAADEMRRVRPHLKTCLACRATLREYRAAPARMAGLVPPVVALAGGGGGAGFLGRVLQAVQERFAGVAEIASAQKAAAVAGSVVVLAGGGAAGIEAIKQDPPRIEQSAFDPATPVSVTPVAASVNPAAAPGPTAQSRVAPAAASAPAPSEAVRPRHSQRRGATEFDPGTTAGPAPSSPAPAPPAAPRSAPASVPARSPAASGGEFGP